MAATTFTTALSIGELEANYALSCKAMRSVCWSRLSRNPGNATEA
jgi:hypothetical protein